MPVFKLRDLVVWAVVVLALSFLGYVTGGCSDPVSTDSPPPEWPVDTVFVVAYEDSAAMGSCTVCNSQIATPYFCNYEECAELAHAQGMTICRWAQLDRIPAEWY